MRVLLDECVDRRLAGDIEGHDVTTVPEAGWTGRFSIAVIVLRPPSNRLTDLRGLVPQLLGALPVAKRGEVTWVGAEQRA